MQECIEVIVCYKNLRMGYKLRDANRKEKERQVIRLGIMFCAGCSNRAS
ncbi:hypothetical protein M2137_002160 [Parabacteroides sp. PFB2-10]|nr:hypothetical protein [Parabacteroides sp. PFB2-10]